MTAYKGKFITFEGGDGAGKTTQVKLLATALEKTGLSVVTTREPGGTPQAERIRDLLLQRDSGNFEPMTEALLLFAARREHLTQKIWPAMEKGAFVISDRFADSTRAFQGAGMGLDLRVINDLYKTVIGDFAPDLTFVFDIDPETGLARSAARQTAAKNTEDRYERMGVDFQKRLRQGFLDIARAEPNRCVVINAARAVDDIHAEIIGIISARLSLPVQRVAHG